MSSISHHVPDRLLLAYASGSLGQAFSLVVASHVSMCSECRAALEAHWTVGGALLDEVEGAPLPRDVKTDVMARLDEPFEERREYPRDGVLPGPVVTALRGARPRWRSLGFGVQQDILLDTGEGRARLISIPGGQAMPDHGHAGMEMTLVLQGSFRDGTGHFGVGDVEVAGEDLDHGPVATEGETCICLAATDAPLRFKSFVPRVLQPVFRI